MDKIPDTIDQSDLKYWISMFGKTSLNIRLELTKKIIKLGSKAVPALVEGLNDDVWSVRQDCANALAIIGDGRAINPLKNSLFDKEKGVRFESARAIAKIGDDEDKQFLIQIAKETPDDEFRRFIYDCLTDNE